MLSSIVLILVGLLPLLFGRRIFWLFVGVAGFFLGTTLSQYLLPDQAVGVRLLLALFVGIIFAGLAIAIQKPMAMIAGFLALGSLGQAIGSQLDGPPWLSWLLFLIFGIIGMILAYMLFDWALIIGSALNGAVVMTSGLTVLLDLTGWVGPLLILVLAAFGIWFQARDLRGGDIVASPAG